MSESKPNVTVVGAHGFIGRRVAAALSRSATFTVSQAVRQQAVAGRSGFDLRHAPSIKLALEGASVVVHAASYLGPNARMCDEVNREGTRNLIREAKRLGIDRVVYVSTAAVYGRGPFRGIDETRAVVAPASELSRSRSDAERFVLDHGGIVVRPHLVLGTGDRWVIPTICRLITTLEAQIDDGAALHSAIHVRTLGEAVAWLATQEKTAPGSYHVGGRAVTASALTTWAVEAGLIAPAKATVSLDGARLSLVADHQLRRAAELLGVDHVFDVNKLKRAGFDPPSLSSVMDKTDLAWYREHMVGAGNQ